MTTLTMTEPISRVTPDELLARPDSISYELVDGKLLERHMGMESSEIAMRIGILLGAFLKTRRLGHLYGADASYECFPDGPTDVRKPDVSFIRHGRLPGERTPKGHCPIPPDLAIEVVSPGDLAYELEEKIEQYQSVKIPLIWVVYPQQRTVRVFRSTPTILTSTLHESEILSGEDVLPGFSCKVSEFFSDPPTE